MAGKDRFEREELWKKCRHRREGVPVELPDDAGSASSPTLCDLKLGSLKPEERVGLTVGLCRARLCPFQDERDVP